MPEPCVLITTYHQAFLTRGGGEAEILSIENRLKQSGLIADIYGPYSRDLTNYDVVLHFSVHGGGLSLLEQIHSTSKPIVLWPNCWFHEGLEYPTESIQRHVNLADIIIFKSQSEESNFRDRIKLEDNKIRHIPTQAHSAFLGSAPADLFKSLYGIDNYAIWCGVIEPIKNQLAVIEVLKEKDIPLVIIGNTRDENYYQRCFSSSSNNSIFIKDLPYASDLLRSAIKESVFYIEVPFEPPGLSAIEAGLTGTKLILSDLDWSREHFGEIAFYADPNCKESIATAVEEAIASDYNAAHATKTLSKYCANPEETDPLTSILREVV